MRISLASLEELQGEVARASELVRLQEQHAPEFAAAVKAWLSALEHLLATHAPVQAAELAGLRSTLLAVERGVVPAGVTLRQRPTRSRFVNAVAAESVPRAADVVSRVVQEARSPFAEAEARVRQLVALARFRRIVPRPDSAGGDALARADGDPAERRHRVLELWRAFQSNDELASAAVRIEGLVGTDDALVVLERALRVP